MEASHSIVTVRARSAESGESAERDAPEPFPEPIAHARQSLEWPSPLACPHCMTLSRSYRELHGTYLVCGACGRSFPIAHVI